MKTTTNPDGWRFTFTITDAARFLGKSPVTLRGWERKNLVRFPRESEGGDRRFTTDDIRALAYHANTLKRITQSRLELVLAAVTLLEYVERENNAYSANRSARIGQDKAS